MVVRGFAPFQCAVAQKFNEAEFRVEFEKFLQILPEHRRKQVRPQQPYARNHQLSFSITGGKSECIEVAAIWNDWISVNDYKIRNCSLRAATEISPNRRAQCKNFFEALEHVRSQVSVEKFEVCQKGLKIYEVKDWELVGSTPVGSTTWKWEDKGCAALGFDPKTSAAAEQGDVDM